MRSNIININITILFTILAVSFTACDSRFPSYVDELGGNLYYNYDLRDIEYCPDSIDPVYSVGEIILRGVYEDQYVIYPNAIVVRENRIRQSLLEPEIQQDSNIVQFKTIPGLQDSLLNHKDDSGIVFNDTTLYKYGFDRMYYWIITKTLPVRVYGPLDYGEFLDYCNSLDIILF